MNAELEAFMDQVADVVGIKVKKTGRTKTDAAAAHGDGAAKPRQRRRRSSGGETRRDMMLREIADNPGITVAEIAAKAGVEPNSLYTPLRGLEGDGAVKKDGTRLYRAHHAPAATEPSAAVNGNGDGGSDGAAATEEEPVGAAVGNDRTAE
jgi:hypothetical protein